MPLVGFAFTDCALDFLAGLPPKIRRQVAKKAKALRVTPFPPTSKKLHDVETPDGDPVYRERSGDYRILYIVRSEPIRVVILDIDHRKDVYRMPKTKTDPADDMRIKQSEFDLVMSKALSVAAPPEKAEKSAGEEGSKPKNKNRLSAYPRNKKA